MGKFNELAKLLGVSAEKYGDDAAKILEKIDNSHLASVLYGGQREEYMKALDEVYGNANKRAEEFNIDLEKLKKLEKDSEDVRKNLDFHEVNYDEEGIPNKLRILDKDTGKQLGVVPYEVKDDRIIVGDKNFKPEKTSTDPFSANWSYIIPKEQGKGIGTAAYRELEKRYNLPIVPSDNQTLAGNNFWNRERTGIDELEKNIKNAKGLLEQVGQYKNRNSLDLDYINQTQKELIENEKKLATIQNSSRPFGNPRSSKAAFDPRFKDSKYLLSGGLAGSQLPQTDISPLPILKKISEGYESAKNELVEPVARSMNFGNDPTFQKVAEGSIGMAVDPVNYLNGPLGGGIAALQGASSFMPDDKEAKLEALRRIRGQ